MYFLKSKASLHHQLFLSAPVPLFQHMLGHCKQLTRAEERGCSVWYRHLAYVHFWASRFRQMALTVSMCSETQASTSYGKARVHGQNLQIVFDSQSAICPSWSHPFGSSFKSFLLSSFPLSCIYQQPCWVLCLRPNWSDCSLFSALECCFIYLKYYFYLQPLLSLRLCHSLSLDSKFPKGRDGLLYSLPLGSKLS